VTGLLTSYGHKHTNVAQNRNKNRALSIKRRNRLIPVSISHIKNVKN